MGKRFIIAAVLVLTVSALLCCAAFAQEEQPTTDEQEPPITTEGGQETTTGHIFLYKDGQLVQVERDVMGGNQMVEFAIIELLNGPSDEEKTAGYVTYIPDGVKLQYTTIKQDRTEFGVNLSRELLSLSGDEDSSSKALTQIVETIRDVSGIESVNITVAGEAMGDTPQDAFEALGVPREDIESGAQGAEASSEGGSTGLVLAIVFGSLGAAILIFLVVFLIRRKSAADEPAKKKKKAGKSKAGKKSGK